MEKVKHHTGSDSSQTMLAIVNHIILQHPGLASHIEQMAATSQGKGYSSISIDQEVDLLLKLLKVRPKLAIDIGGNTGEYTAELRKRDEMLEVHTFEPSAINVEKLNQRFKNDPLVKIVPYALSDTAGPATLFSNAPGSGLGSLVKRQLDHYKINFDTTETINTIRFEDYWNTKLQGQQLDLVKIDVEGYELAVLKGFGSALGATRVLQFEFGGTDIDTRTFFRDFWNFFKESKFTLFRMTPHGLDQISEYNESHENFQFTNFCASKNE